MDDWVPGERLILVVKPTIGLIIAMALPVCAHVKLQRVVVDAPRL